MKYKFPVINHISDLLPAIEGDTNFIVAEKDGYTVVTYNLSTPEAFPPIKVAGGSAKMRAERSLHNALRRECRGIIFCSETGKILRRPYHKFFNVGEKQENSNLNLTEEHVLLEKLDGSMLVPFYLNGKVVWGTKAGLTPVAEPVQAYVNRNPKYQEFVTQVLAAGYSPIFEWCSRIQKIVLDYPEDRLILTAIRDIVDGHYAHYSVMQAFSEEFDIPVVQKFDSMKDIKDLVAHTRDLQDLEGYVIRFDDGHMAKLKCDWYCTIHKALEGLYFEKDVIEMIMKDNVDDIKAIIPIDRVNALEEYASELTKNVYAKIDEIYDSGMVSYIKAHEEANFDEKETKKQYALKVKDRKGSSIYFKLFDIIKNEKGSDVYPMFKDHVFAYVIGCCSSQSKVDSMRWLIGERKWEYV